MVKIAGIQFSCSEKKKLNIEKALILAEIATEQGVKILCFQELFNTPWFPEKYNDNNFRLAEEIPGETTQIFSDFARQKGVIIICPVFEKTHNGLYYNSAVVINKNGEILGIYRKNHIPSIPLWEEKSYFEPGNKGFEVFKTEYATIGVQLCWDNFFPEGSRILALKGAEIIFAPTAAAFNSQKRWQNIICANAIANNIFIFRVNRVGQESNQYFYGKTFCSDPNGELLSEPSGLNDSVIVTNVDFQMIRSVRSEYGYIKNRRAELYHEIIRRT